MEKEEKHAFLDDGRFIVFEDGRVYKRIDPSVTKTGYQYVAVGKRTYPIHRLVAENFVPNPENKPEVNHIDGDKTNNNVSNLEWVTRSENVQHAISHGLFKKTAGHDKPKVKTPIWYCRKAAGMTQNDLAEKLGVNPATISLWENGNLAPKTISFPRIAEALNCTINDLFEKDGNRWDFGTDSSVPSE